jgi:hypothetical protein
VSRIARLARAAVLAATVVMVAVALGADKVDGRAVLAIACTFTAAIIITSTEGA